VEVSIARLQQATNHAVETLERNLLARRKESVQVRAAMAILDYAVRAIELMDLEERVAGLKERLGGTGQDGRRIG
jgi:predicted nuclease with TOPRIM domain